MSTVKKAQEERVSREATEASLFGDQQTADITSKKLRASPAARLTVFREHMSILGPCAPTSTRFFPFPWEHRVLELRGFDAIPCLYVRICAESQCVSPDIWSRRTVVVHDTSPIGNNIHTRFNKSYWHI